MHCQTTNACFRPPAFIIKSMSLAAALRVHTRCMPMTLSGVSTSSLYSFHKSCVCSIQYHPLSTPPCFSTGANEQSLNAPSQAVEQAPLIKAVSWGNAGVWWGLRGGCPSGNTPCGWTQQLCTRALPTGPIFLLMLWRALPHSRISPLVMKNKSNAAGSCQHRCIQLSCNSCAQPGS